MRSKRKSRTISDAANTITRYILSRISESFGQWTEKEEKETLDFFQNECPYTGKNIEIEYQNGKCDLDHIIGHNKKKCGLHIFGNLVLTTKATNSDKSKFDANDKSEDKSKESYERFIDSLDIPDDLKKANIARLQKFREKHTNYAQTHEKNFKIIQEFLEKKYEEIKEMAEKSVKELAEKLQVTYVPPSRTNMSESEKSFWKWNSEQKKKNTSYYKAALHRILKNSEKSFDEFLSTIEVKTIEEYQSGGNKSELGKKGGIAALKMLLEYKANKSLQK